MDGKGVTAKRRGRRGKKENGRQTWQGRLRGWSVNLLLVLVFIAIYVPANFLTGCTLVDDVPEAVLWVVLVMPVVLLLVWAWFRGELSWMVFSLYSFIGLLGGWMLVLFLTTVFLGANYIVPCSEPYRHRAVITSMKEEHHYRQMAHNYIYFRLIDSGVCFSYDCDREQYDSLRCGDTCMVTFRDGLLGYPVIRHVELAGRTQQRPSREMLERVLDGYWRGRAGRTAPDGRRGK